MIINSTNNNIVFINGKSILMFPPKPHTFVSLQSNFGIILSRVLTWKNLIRGISAAISGILIKRGIYYFFDVDILTYFVSNIQDFCTYIIAFWYLLFNYYVGLTASEFFNQLLINWVKESTKKILGISLGIEWPKNKLPLIGPSNNEFTSNIKEVPVKEVTIMHSTRSSLPSRSPSPLSSRPLSPFSRPATPDFGAGEYDPRNNVHNSRNTPLNPSSIVPEYFHRHNDSTDAFYALDTLITRIIKNLYSDIISPEWTRTNNQGAILWPFSWSGLFDGSERNNPFYTWHNIKSMDECSELQLRCIISRVEYAKSASINDQTNNWMAGSLGVSRINVYDRLLDEANRSLRSRFSASSSRNTNN